MIFAAPALGILLSSSVAQAGIGSHGGHTNGIGGASSFDSQPRILQLQFSVLSPDGVTTLSSSTASFLWQDSAAGYVSFIPSAGDSIPYVGVLDNYGDLSFQDAYGNDVCDMDISSGFVGCGGNFSLASGVVLSSSIISVDYGDDWYVPRMATLFAYGLGTGFALHVAIEGLGFVAAGMRREISYLVR